jgi:hypothetical protein
LSQEEDEKLEILLNNISKVTEKKTQEESLKIRTKVNETFIPIQLKIGKTMTFWLVYKKKATQSK